MSVQIITLLIAVCIGISVFYANPRRPINQAFALVSIWVALWFYLLWAVTRPNAGNPVPWLKAISAYAAFLPWLLWWIGRCAIAPDSRWRDFFWSGKYWLLFSIAMAAIASSNWFIPAESTPRNPLRGPGYSIYAAGQLAAYLFLLADAVFKIRRLAGIHLVELKTLLVGGSISATVGLGMTTLPPMLGLPSLASYAPVAVLLFYALTAWGISSRRIFDAKQLFITVLRRVSALIFASWLLALWLSHTADRLPRGVAMLAGFTLCFFVVLLIEQRVKDSSFSSRTKASEQVRASLLSAGREEVEPDSLLERYTKILQQWSRARSVHIFLGNSTADASNPWNLSATGPGLQLLVHERWATPESLGRRRVTPAVEEVDRFMADQQLGVIVFSPQARGTTPIAIGLSARDDKTPFLWPDIQHLMEWSELMEVAISRVQLTKRARETEQVATAGLLGASLAHEIRNPLVALKTFAQLLPERHNDPEFRDEFSQLLQKEVGRIESLTEQLLKLSTPRQPVMRMVRVNEIVLDCAALLKPKFSHGNTKLTLELAPDERPVSADSGSISQVVINLLVNALQALADKDGEREVVIRTRMHPRELTLDCADNGPGVTPKQRERLFQPFSSNKVNGFGLGLALSANIMRAHKGSIALVDTAQPGATFRLTFPCPPS